MKKTKEYLDFAKQINNVTSDYALAKELDITHQELSFLRNEERKINETTATKLAILIGIDPMEIIASANYWKGSDKNKTFWKWYQEKENKNKQFPRNA